MTEGAITLNQVYNVLDEPLEKLTEDSGVTELCTFLQLADRVNSSWAGPRIGPTATSLFANKVFWPAIGSCP